MRLSLACFSVISFPLEVRPLNSPQVWSGKKEYQMKKSMNIIVTAVLTLASVSANAGFKSKGIKIEAHFDKNIQSMIDPNNPDISRASIAISRGACLFEEVTTFTDTFEVLDEAHHDGFNSARLFTAAGLALLDNAGRGSSGSSKNSLAARDTGVEECAQMAALEGCEEAGFDTGHDENTNEDRDKKKDNKNPIYASPAHRMIIRPGAKFDDIDTDIPNLSGRLVIYYSSARCR